MLAKERPVALEHLHYLARYIQNRLKVCPLKEVNSEVFRIDSGRNRRVYMMFNSKHEVIAWLFVQRRNGWNAFEVNQSWVYEEYRGAGLGTKLYQAAIDDDRVLLAAGNIHSKFSRAVWKSFVKKELFDVWACDFRKPHVIHEVHYDDTRDKLVSDVKLYDYRTSYDDFFYKWRPEDVRLLARSKHVRR